MAELLLWIILVLASFSLPTMAVKLAPRRTGPAPSTSHLSVGQQRGVRRCFLKQWSFWFMTAMAIGLATAVTSLIYAVPSPPPLVVVTMLGVPYLVAVSAVMYFAYPVWHRVVTDELKRLGELRHCPSCSYDISETKGGVCPECGSRF